MKRDMTEAYQAAERLTPWNLTHAVLNGEPDIRWLDDETFYYARESRQGDFISHTFMQIHCPDGAEQPLFDHAALADALGCEYLPFDSCDVKDGVVSFVWQDFDCKFRIADRSFTRAGWHETKTVCTSPDGSKEVFSEGYDLYLRDTKTGQKTRITYDGQKDFAYGSCAEYSGAVGRRLAGIRELPGVLWSPDSSCFLTYRLDQRLVPELYVLQSYDDPHTESIRPRLHTYKCSFPEDSAVPLAFFYLYDVESDRLCPLDLAPQQTGGSLLHPDSSIARWLPDSSALYLTTVSRGSKSASFCIVRRDGSIHTVLTETADDFLNLDTWGELDGFGSYRFSNFLTDDGSTIFWQSERDDLARLFRYDAATGACCGAVTPPDCLVGRLLAKDDDGQWIYFMASNLPGSSDPYYQKLCRVHYDGTGFAVLTPEDGMHRCTVRGSYLTDTWSRVDLPPVTVLRRTDGTLIREIVQSDVRDLMERGYVIPERFCITASDGKTPLYGILVRPANFDPNQSYPLIDYIYGGMQCCNVPKAFTWKGAIEGREAMGGLQEFAQLGFAGIILDGLGTPGRGKALHRISYENIHGCAGLKDHVTGLARLKELFPFLDTDRAGIWGNSGGGCAVSRAMLEYPDVYKVGVSSAGNHDQRMYNNSWTENYYGLYDPEIYRKGDNTALADNLKGHLFLVHGAMDDNVAMSQTIRLADALIRADKDFDFLILPRTDHNVPANPYFIRRKLDYFVRYLLEEEPPAGYRFVLPEEKEV